MLQHCFPICGLLLRNAVNIFRKGCIKEMLPRWRNSLLLSDALTTVTRTRLGAFNCGEILFTPSSHRLSMDGILLSEYLALTAFGILPMKLAPKAQVMPVLSHTVLCCMHHTDHQQLVLSSSHQSLLALIQVFFALSASWTARQ